MDRRRFLALGASAPFFTAFLQACSPRAETVAVDALDLDALARLDALTPPRCDDSVTRYAHIEAVLMRTGASVLREGLADRVEAATAHEASEQAYLSTTNDAAEGIAAVGERRTGNFTAT